MLRPLDQCRSNVLAEKPFQLFVRFTSTRDDDSPFLLQLPNPDFERVLRLWICVPLLPEVFKKITGISNHDPLAVRIGDRDCIDDDLDKFRGQRTQKIASISSAHLKWTVFSVGK
jgi:hypothetical protein